MSILYAKYSNVVCVRICVVGSIMHNHIPVRCFSYRVRLSGDNVSSDIVSVVSTVRHCEVSVTSEGERE